MAKKLVKKAAKTAKTAKATTTASTSTSAPKISPASKVRSKSEVVSTIAEQTGLARKQVAHVFETMRFIIEKDLSPKGPGVFSVPGMMKVSVVRKPATKARMGKNPFTGEQVMFKAKPARNVVKVRALKALKELV